MIAPSLFVVAIALGGTSALAQVTSSGDVGVTIEGGCDATGHEYNWSVTNRGSSPIISLEFPHHHADLCIMPEGLKSELTERVCAGRSESPSTGIAPGQIVQVRLRVGPSGAQRGTGTVTVRFADGTAIPVSGVEVPEAESAGDQFVPMIGMAAIFIVIIAAGAVRKKKSAPSTPDSPAD